MSQNNIRIHGTFLAILLELFHRPNLRWTLGKLFYAPGTGTNILQSKDFLRFLPHMQDLPLPINNTNLFNVERI